MLVLALESLEGCRLPRMAAGASLTTDFPVAIATGSHPFPSRTRKLRLSAPMVLGGRPPGRVGRRRELSYECPFPLGNGHSSFSSVTSSVMPAARRPSSASGARRSGAPQRGAAKRRDPRADGRERPARRPEGEEGARPGRRTTTSGRRPPPGKGDDKRPARRVPPRQVVRPQTTAEARAAEVRVRRGPRPPRPAEVAPPPWEPEQWVAEEEPIRRAAEKATARARPARSARPADLAPEVADDLARAADPGRHGPLPGTARQCRRRTGPWKVRGCPPDGPARAARRA